MNIHLKEVLFVEMGGGEGGSQQFLEIINVGNRTRIPIFTHPH